MTRYDRIQASLRAVESRLQHDQIRDLLLVVDLPDHLQELGTPHVDAARSTLDWFCSKHPDHPICLATGSARNTKKAWEAFGYAHLPKQYPRLRFVDLNRDPMPPSTFVVFLIGLDRRVQEVWSELHVRPSRYYTPTGHVWRRVGDSVEHVPHVTVVDAEVGKGRDRYDEPIPLRLGQAYAFIGFEGADQVKY